jgi:arylsulfatase A-like enzyme
MDIMREYLPIPEKKFEGTLGRTEDESKPDKPVIITPPEGAPNVVIVLLDDVGFGASDVFGGPVPMPALAEVADEGLRYNAFHTTALCSPTRAALLTGRNHHSAHFGAISEIAVGYPGYDSVIPKSKVTVAEILKGNGYNTAFIGKNHITPMWETRACMQTGLTMLTL